MIEQPEFNLQKLLDNMQTFVGILDTDGTLLLVNNSPMIASGLEEKEVIGKRFWDCFWFNYDNVSIGVASLQADALNEVDLLKQADSSLYIAKNTGRDRCQIFIE